MCQRSFGGDRDVAVLHAAGVEFGQLHGALGELLHAAFAQVAHAELKQLAHLLGRGGFGDGDERDLRRIALGRGARLGDAVVHLLKLFRQRRSLGHVRGSFPTEYGCGCARELASEGLHYRDAGAHAKHKAESGELKLR
jgi:hypothetical protein